MSCYVLLSAVSNPSSAPCRPSPPHIARLLHPPVAVLSGLEGRGRAPPPPQPHLIWNKFQQPRKILRMASNLEVVSMIAEIGQQQ
jgi:hypothetical protein